MNLHIPAGNHRPVPCVMLSLVWCAIAVVGGPRRERNTSGGSPPHHRRPGLAFGLGHGRHLRQIRAGGHQAQVILPTDPLVHPPGTVPFGARSGGLATTTWPIPQARRRIDPGPPPTSCADSPPSWGCGRSRLLLRARRGPAYLQHCRGDLTRRRTSARYRKCFPWRPWETVTAGTEFVVFDIEGVGRAGLMICYDAWFPEVARHLAWMGAEVIFNPTATYTSDREQELVLARANAIVNQVYVVNTNMGGRPGPARSVIVDPEGHVLQMAGDGEEYQTEVLDLRTVRQDPFLWIGWPQPHVVTDREGGTQARSSVLRWELSQPPRVASRVTMYRRDPESTQESAATEREGCRSVMNRHHGPASPARHTRTAIRSASLALALVVTAVACTSKSTSSPTPSGTGSVGGITTGKTLTDTSPPATGTLDSITWGSAHR